MEVFASLLNFITGQDFMYLTERVPSRSGKREYAKYVVHHKDGNHENNTFDNLVIVSAEDHKKLHHGSSLEDCDFIDVAAIVNGSKLCQEDEVTEDRDSKAIFDHIYRILEDELVSRAFCKKIKPRISDEFGLVTFTVDLIWNPEDVWPAGNSEEGKKSILLKVISKLENQFKHYGLEISLVGLDKISGHFSL